LVVKPDGLGDLLMAVPFLRGLRESFPQAAVTAVVPPASASLLENCPYVDEVLPFTNKWEPLFRFRGIGRARAFAREFLAPRNFDWALLPRWDVDYYHGGLLVAGSGAAVRAGFSNRVSPRKRALNPGYDRFYTLAALGGRGLHEVHRNLELLRQMGGAASSDRLEFWPEPGDAAALDRVLLEQRIDAGEKLVALGPGATRAVKRWPLERYAELAGWLRERFGAKLLILGSDRDRAEGERLKNLAGPGVHNLAGLLSLRQSGAALSRCGLFIGNDSGTKHLAAAAGCPVVEISWVPQGGDEELDAPRRFHAFGVPTRVLRPPPNRLFCKNKCAALFPHCVLQVGLEDVKQAVTELMGPG
jgi:heptosyltransferase-2